MIQAVFGDGRKSGNTDEQNNDEKLSPKPPGASRVQETPPYGLKEAHFF